jgi:hypothetical protein
MSHTFALDGFFSVCEVMQKRMMPTFAMLTPICFLWTFCPPVSGLEAEKTQSIMSGFRFFFDDFPSFVDCHVFEFFTFYDRVVFFA